MNSFNWSCQADSAGSKTWSLPNPSWQRGDRIQEGDGELGTALQLGAICSHPPPCILSLHVAPSSYPSSPFPGLSPACSPQEAPSHPHVSRAAAFSGIRQVTPLRVSACHGLFPIGSIGQNLFQQCTTVSPGSTPAWFCNKPEWQLATQGVLQPMCGILHMSAPFACVVQD